MAEGLRSGNEKAASLLFLTTADTEILAAAAAGAVGLVLARRRR